MSLTVCLEDDEEYIALCDLLKTAGLADSGGQAKMAIAAGEVCRNGVVETRKTAKIRDGEFVSFRDVVVYVGRKGDDCEGSI
ncbi:MAG: RNA-binding S4 domain-containing protein [Neisseria sp.]|nr:RNA-binding S4 domain-containing protein [Neisseria sp.]